VGRVEAFPAKHRPDLAGFGAGVGLPHDGELVIGREPPAPGDLRNLRIRWCHPSNVGPGWSQLRSTCGILLAALSDYDKGSVSRDVGREGWSGSAPSSPSGRRRWTSSPVTERRSSPSIDFPVQHWIHLRTSNPIESTFPGVRTRTDVMRGPGSRAAGLSLCFKLIEVAEGRWRRVNAPELAALVRAGAMFVNGRLVSEPIRRTSRDYEIPFHNY
jgi:hypothetical protein